jgi:GR25 family glycosyltransferase involved in LPS biosynthesis
MNQIDRIVCINLKERADKYNNVKTVFEKLNINVEFSRPDKNPANSGSVGCFERHIEVIKKSYKNNDQLVLIFEDDITSTLSYSESNIEYVVDFIKQNEWCEYFQIGYSVFPLEMFGYFFSKTFQSKKNASVIQYNGESTHAYILTHSGMKRVLKNWEEYAYNRKMDLGNYYKSLFKKNGASICPILFEKNYSLKDDNDKGCSLYYRMKRLYGRYQYYFSFLYYLSLVRLYFLLLVILSIISFCIIASLAYTYRDFLMRKYREISYKVKERIR